MSGAVQSSTTTMRRAHEVLKAGRSLVEGNNQRIGDVSEQ
jgi:hypothetical protein